MVEQTPSPRDEDAFEMPKTWKRHLHPRRGGAPGPTIKPAGPGETELRTQYAGRIEEVLAHRRTDPALAAAAREHLAGRPVPLGAAVVAAIPEAELSTGEMTVRFVDAWVTTYGLPFAVQAFLDRCDIGFGPSAGRGGVVSMSDSRWYFDRARLEGAAKRLRVLLAAAPDAAYRDVVELLTPLRTTPARQVISAYLVPTELDWVAACCTAATADQHPRQLLLRALGSPEHLTLLGPAARISVADCYYVENLITLAEGVGPAIAPYLAEAFDEHQDESRRRKGLLEVLGRLPGDEAFRLMLERAENRHMRAALHETMQRYPVRALRVLATATTGGDATAQELLTGHLRANATLVARVRQELPAEVRAVVEKLSGADDRVPEASADELPHVLVDPPWARAERNPKPVVLKGLVVPGEPSVAWAPGERDAWLRTEIANPGKNSVTLEPVPPPAQRDGAWEKRIANIREGVALEPFHKEPYWQAGMLAKGPEELVRPVLREWTADWSHRGLGTTGPWSPSSWLRPLAARFELDALPAVLDFARSRPAHGSALLLPFLSGEVAGTVAHWLLNVDSVRETAIAWFARHGRAALPFLVPVALGRAGRARRAAEYALHFLADQEGEDAVVDVARGHGERAVELVEALLADDPESLRPRKKVPTQLGVDVEVLPQVLVRGRERALPVPAVRHLLTLLALSAPDGEDPDLVTVLEACDERALADFGWALFQHWWQHGAGPRHAWQFAALGRLGNDGTVRRLVPLIQAWPQEECHHHAVRGLDVLSRIGSDHALRALDRIARHSEYQGLMKHAGELLAQVAVVRGLTPRQFDDLLARGT